MRGIFQSSESQANLINDLDLKSRSMVRNLKLNKSEYANQSKRYKIDDEGYNKIYTSNSNYSEKKYTRYLFH